MITITGATGKTGSKVATLLLGKGQKIRVIGRSAERLKSLTDQGAEAKVGDSSDPTFLTAAFKGSDVVYALIPPRFDTPDFIDHYNDHGRALCQALTQSGVAKAVFLSSLGAEQTQGTGPVVGLHNVEKMLRDLDGVTVAVLRPGYFMENTFMNLGLIKNQKINGGPTDPDAPISLIATRDIAKKAAELLTHPSFRNNEIIDLFGDSLSYRQITRTIGELIGNPDLPYVQFPDADALGAMTAMGLSTSVAQSYVDLSHAISQGKVKPTTIPLNVPNVPTRFAQFAEEELLPAYQAV